LPGRHRKVKAAIKYCGGCSPGFERKKAVFRMLARLADTVEIVDPGRQDIDLLIAVEGCPTACADLSPYRADRVVILSTQAAVDTFQVEPQ
jgi:hypothetical protein